MSFVFKDNTADDLVSEFSRIGLNASCARKLQAAVIRNGCLPESLPDLSYKIIRQIKEESEIPGLKIADKVISSKDGFARYVFNGSGAGIIEAVRIPLMHRPHDRKYVVCVSSQIGCACGCVFCHTGAMGFVRNLRPWEIVDQVIRIRDDSEYPVRGVVFMGMGEPLLNYDAVMKAARIISEPCGMAISARSITISTVGIVPGIRRLIADNMRLRLIVSLASADRKKRSELMPVENSYPLPELIQCLREYNRATSERVIFAWPMISGFNTSEEEVIALAELVSGIPVKIDLIDINDPSGRFLPPGQGELSRFRGALKRILGMPFARRYSGGFDIKAACGMLAQKEADVTGF